jgi:glycerol-3-phosphate acyltransferase PlsX
VGEEDSKGNDLVLRTRELFKGGALNFIGNVEGRDVFTGAADVIVCDGFVGNVVLKLAEGVAELIEVRLRQELGKNLFSRLGTLLTLPAFKRFKKTVDYSEAGGAPLLGINGIGIISHGRSSPKAIKNAIRSAAEMIRAELPVRLDERLRQARPARGKAEPPAGQ